ncbi:hypothetical protein AAG906_000751 [Vitis piasezkii]
MGGGDAPNGGASEGSEGVKPSSQDSRDLNFLMASCYPISLKFIDICYRVKLEKKKSRGGLCRPMLGGPTKSSDRGSTTETIQEKTILNGVTGMACPGEILAVLGPSGSGKSTLLNALAGRIQGHCFTGTVLANGRKLTKPVLRRTGFVTQDDILYPHLTVRETLIFCSLLRLPNTLTKQEKISLADSVIAELGLAKCENTIIGNSFIRGVSGREEASKHSTRDADKPKSSDTGRAHVWVGLDLGIQAGFHAGVAGKQGKTIVTSMHQPSSRSTRCFTLVCHLDGVSEREKPNIKQALVSSYNSLLAPKVKDACNMDTNVTAPKETVSLASKECRRRCSYSGLSTWFNQFSILLQRGLKERKHESFNSLRVFQVIAAALLAGLILGLLFFIAIFWGVFPSFNSVFAFPQERAIFMKERASGMYTLSSYFMARIVGDMPMELILPMVFLTVAYWMAGLKPEVGAFLLTLVILLGYVLVSQGLGLALGAAIMDAKKASTMVTVTMLAFVLTGGFYVHKMPSCMTWIKYISTTFYSYRLLINVQYGEGKRISSLLGCSHHGINRASCKFIEEDIGGQISPAFCITAMVFMFVGYRLLAYLALRCIKA